MADPGAPVELGLIPPPPPPNPLDTVGKFAQVQNSLNQNRLFQQTFAARQQAGQIMAAAPDMETGLANIMKSPAAPFMGEFVGQVRAAQLAQVQYQGEIQHQAQGTMKEFGQGLAGVLMDPGQWDAVKASKLATTSALSRPAVAQAMEDLRTGLVEGLPADPVAARAILNKRIAATMIGSGTGVDALNAIVGTPTLMDQGNVKTPGITLGGLGAPVGMPGAPGQFSGAQPGIGLGIPPSYGDTPSGARIPLPALGPGAGQPGPGPVAGSDFALPPPGSGIAPGGGLSALPLQAILDHANGGASPPGGPAVAPSPVTLPRPAPGTLGTAGNGTPLVLPPGATSPTEGTGAGGLNVLSSSQQKISDGLASEFTGAGLKEFRGAQTSMDMLTHMGQDYDNMVRAGGLLTPGTGASLRTNLAKTANSLTQILDPKGSPPFDSGAIASVEDFIKQTNRLGVTVTNQLLGAQHEAASTIQSMIKSVPSIDNTYMGGKLLLGGIQASVQRTIDQRNFENAWQKANQGNLTGAAEAFNDAYPAETYAQHVLEQFGMNEKGFTSPDAVKAAVRQGYLTKAQAAGVLRTQFPGQFGQAPPTGGQ